MERILLNFSESEFSSHINRLRTAASQVRKVVEQINAINSYQVDATGLKDLLHGRGEQLGKRITDATQAELDRAGIASSSIVKAALNGDAEKYWSIFKAFRQPSHDLSQFVIIDESGKVSIAENAEETLREEYCYYLTTEQAYAAWQAHQKAVESLNELLRLCPQLRPMNLNQIVGIPMPGFKFEVPILAYERLVQPLA